MVYVIEKKYANEDLEIELTSFIHDKQNVWFQGKDVAQILVYCDTDKAIRNHLDEKYKKSYPAILAGHVRYQYFISEPDFYSLVFSSKLPTAKKFQDWVFSMVLPSIRKYGQYKLFDNPWNKMIMIGNETNLHYKVVDLIRKYYPDSILVVGLGENQDTEDKRPDSYKKGYTCGQPDQLVLNYHKDYKKYRNNGYAFVLSNDYDKICRNIHEYMKGIKLPCKYA